MAEYIDRNYIGKAYIDLCKALNQKSKICPGANEPTVKNVFALIMHAPVADVAEVRHGRWIPSDMGGGEPDEAYICSECGEPWILNEGTPEENNMRYCPACGARMDKEDEHEVS